MFVLDVSLQLSTVLDPLTLSFESMNMKFAIQHVAEYLFSCWLYFTHTNIRVNVLLQVLIALTSFTF
jgi:hypothetical protein